MPRAMKSTSIIRKVLAAMFGMAVVFTVSVREVHYLFAQNHVHEHCENHLHAADEHAHCAVCKFDISLFTDEVSHVQVATPETYPAQPAAVYHSVVLYSSINANGLRGPPAVA